MPKQKLKEFEVVFDYTQHSRGTAIVKAKNKNDAQQIAEEMTADEIKNLNPYDEELNVLEIRKP